MNLLYKFGFVLNGLGVGGFERKTQNIEKWLELWVLHDT